MAVQYQFPILTVEEAVDFINTNMEFLPVAPVRESDFRKPDPARWRLIYGGLFELLVSTPFEDIFQQQRLHMEGAVEYPDLHEDSARMCLFVQCMNRVLVCCGLHDFSIKDITKLMPKRLLKVVSALLNFYKFKEGRMHVFNDMKESMEREKDHYSQLIKSNDELRQRINSIKASRAEKEPEVNRLQQEIQEMNLKMGENYKVQHAAQKSIAEIKTKLAENKASYDDLRLEILEMKKEGEKLSRQIVHSPEKVKETQKRMQVQLSELKAVKAERVQRLLEVRQEAERRKTFMDNDVEQAMKMMRAIVTDTEKKKECDKDIAELQDKIQSQDDTLQNLLNREQEIVRITTSKQEKHSKLSLQHQSKMAGAKESYNQVSQQLEWNAHQHSEDEAHKRQVQQQKTALLEERQSHTKLNQQRMDTMGSAYSKQLETLDSYHAKLVSSWEPVKNAME